MAIPPQFLKHKKGKHKQDSAAKDAKETPAQHKKDLASGKDKPNANDLKLAKRNLLIQQSKGGK
jgi:hypothetical protein